VRKKRKAAQMLPTDTALSPENYPLGSVALRAAVRAMLEWKRRGRKRVEFISHIPRPRADNSRVRFQRVARVAGRDVGPSCLRPARLGQNAIAGSALLPGLRCDVREDKRVGRHDWIPAELREYARSRPWQRVTAGEVTHQKANEGAQSSAEEQRLKTGKSSQTPGSDAVRASDYPLGSLESRAAVRVMLQNRRRAKPVFRVHVVHRFLPDDEPLPESTRHESDDCISETVHTRG
jgi:hypothetical protein